MLSRLSALALPQSLLEPEVIDLGSTRMMDLLGVVLLTNVDTVGPYKIRFALSQTPLPGTQKLQL